MVEGIDINSSESTISIASVKSAGKSFVIVKMGGANVLPIYVSPYYTAQIDRCVAAGMPKAHMWVTGQGNEITQADYFTSHLHQFDKSKDVLALDDELIDSNGEFWTDTKAGNFINRVMSNLGLSPEQIWIYMSVSSVRDNNWPTVVASKCRVWVAAWGTNNGTRVAIDLGGKMPAWHVHQYWSKGSIAGYTNSVDFDYSPLTIGELFGGWSGTNTGGTGGGTTGGGGTGTGTPGNVLSDSDRADIAASMSESVINAIPGIVKGAWEHNVASAIDQGNHWIQTYAAWSQRDIEAVLTVINGDDPAFILAKESSSNIVYALNPQYGTKRALTAGQFNVLQVCSIGYKIVPDASLDAFTTVTG